ncbi:hypothetical protein [Caballeronia sp. LjRoot31]|uniref:hypothetical protein n=1 Tax=Caballeronia sp. LjRoot31 TaxID=3342324 RepID=UPI003ECFADF7
MEISEDEFVPMLWQMRQSHCPPLILVPTWCGSSRLAESEAFASGCCRPSQGQPRIGAAAIAAAKLSSEELKMEAHISLNIAHLPVGIGGLVELRSLDVRPKQTIGMPIDTPVLACPLAPTDAHLLSKCNGRANFGFGHIPRQDSLLMTIRAQIGGLQIYWVTEMADPEVWAAIDKWKKVKRVPVMLETHEGERIDLVFGVFDMPPGTLRNEAHRHGPDPVPTAQRLHDIVSYVGSGVLQTRATTDVLGVPLQQVLANVILTERFAPFLKQSPIPA